MKDWLERLFYGRQGMDEFSKNLFWSGLVCMLLSALTTGILNNILSTLFLWLAIFQLIFAFYRAFSRKLSQREMENYAFLGWKAGKRRKLEAAKERHRQSKDFKFFKCPGCGTMIRVPRGKGRIHIKCKCGYTLYRKT